MQSEYSDIHRGFLQIVMSRGTISKSNANNVLTELCALQNMSAPAENHLELIIDAINKKIRMFDQRVDIVSSMYDGKEFVVMVNTTQSHMKLQATYTPHEIEFFRLLIKEIALADDHAVRNIHVLNLMNQNRNSDFSMTKTEKMLNDWIEEGYFYSDKGYIHLGVRSVAEFGEFIKYKFNVTTCHLCKSIVLKGVDCDAEPCDGRFHIGCIEKYMAKNKKCPMCKETWNSKIT